MNRSKLIAAILVSQMAAGAQEEVNKQLKTQSVRRVVERAMMPGQSIAQRTDAIMQALSTEPAERQIRIVELFIAEISRPFVINRQAMPQAVEDAIAQLQEIKRKTEESSINREELPQEAKDAIVQVQEIKRKAEESTENANKKQKMQ